MTDRERSDEELARTATAPGSEPTPSREAAPLGAELGRYRLQRELGRGGMGVVHAAFDPDLERRVALKVLRSADALEARQRLLREARAMARVTHANVVAVHEVGSADGRDYIAMELLDGGTLEEWLASPHSEREILDAFIAAGRGLAAAHAAGLVHRDFKPHNVLRRKDGSIAVTDFGLVVGIETIPDALTTTLRPGEATADASSTTTPSSLSGLTATGSLLGTPAYMAPEQWMGGAVGPHTDQFAFCVALWEALARERPFGAMSINELKADVCAGKHGDVSKVPRRFRQILVRGLSPDPKKRWPSMNALLAALARADRKPWIAFTLAGGALVAAGVVFAIASHHASPAATCDKPLLEPTVAWTAHDAELLRQKGQALAAKAFESHVQAWSKQRAASCKKSPATRDPQLTCLDGVLARMDVSKRALLASAARSPVEVREDFIDPAVCAAARPPRLNPGEPPELVDVWTVSINRLASDKIYGEADADALVARSSKEPCAAAIAHMIAATYKGGGARVTELEQADRAAQTCGDDRQIADVALFTIDNETEAGTFDTQRLTTQLQKAEALVNRVSQPDLVAQLEIRRASVAILGEHTDEGTQQMEHAIELYKSAHLSRTAINTELRLLTLRERRAKPDDVAKVPAALEDMRERAVAELGETDVLVHILDQYRAYWMWSSGDVVGANALFAKISTYKAPAKPIKITGHVFNERGAPVAGAEVVTGEVFQGDSEYAAGPRDNQLRTKTAADGSFAFDAASADGMVIAQKGDLRSLPQHVMDHVKLIAEATSRISGHVELHGRPAPTVAIIITLKNVLALSNYVLSAPVRADGSYEAAGVPRGEVELQVVYNTTTSAMVNGITVDVEQPVMSGINLDAVPRKRTIYMLIRSTVGAAVPNAQIYVVAGAAPPSRSLQDSRTSLENAAIKIARPLAGEKLPADVVAKSKSGDLFGILEAPDGEASACAIALPEHIDDPEFIKETSKPENLAKIMVQCVPVGLSDTVVVVEVPPWPRFD